jgi:hypothetical protein
MWMRRLEKKRKEGPALVTNGLRGWAGVRSSGSFFGVLGSWVASAASLAKQLWIRDGAFSHSDANHFHEAILVPHHVS